MRKGVRPLDAALIVVVVLIIGIGCYIGYLVWANNMSLTNSSPASREIAAFSAAVKKKPGDIETRMRLAQALSVAGRSNDAIEQYKQVLKLSKDWVPALSGIGFELMKLKDWKGGQDYFKRVIKITEDKAPVTNGPSSLEIAYYYTGISYMEQKDYEQAVAYLRKALALRRDASDTAYALSVSYGKLGILDGQRQMLEYTLQFDPKAPEANYDYGLILLGEGKKADAAEHFRLSADAAPYKKEPQEQLAKLGNASDHLAKAESLASKDASAALAEARIASALDPLSVEAMVLVGKLYEKTKNLDKAAEVYERVLVRDSSNAEASAGLKRVKHD